jgi:hypothetical protein
MARLVTYVSFRSTQGTGPAGPRYRSKPSCYAVYRAELHEGWGDCNPTCHRSADLIWPHVDLVNGEELTRMTPLPEPLWTTLGIARLYETKSAPAYDFGRQEDR